MDCHYATQLPHLQKRNLKHIRSNACGNKSGSKEAGVVINKFASQKCRPRPTGSGGADALGWMWSVRTAFAMSKPPSASSLVSARTPCAHQVTAQMHRLPHRAALQLLRAGTWHTKLLLFRTTESPMQVTILSDRCKTIALSSPSTALGCHGLSSHGLRSYGLSSYGLCSYGL